MHLDVLDVLDTVEEYGLSLTLEGGNLYLHGSNPMLEEIAERIRLVKAEIVELLTPLPVTGLPSVFDTDDPERMPSAPCLACGNCAWRIASHPTFEWSRLFQWHCNSCRPVVVINATTAE